MQERGHLARLGRPQRCGASAYSHIPGYFRPALAIQAQDHPRRGRSANPRCRELCAQPRSEEHTSELQSRENLVCRLLLEKKKKKKTHILFSKKKKKKTKTKKIL